MRDGIFRQGLLGGCKRATGCEVFDPANVQVAAVLSAHFDELTVATAAAGRSACAITNFCLGIARPQPPKRSVGVAQPSSASIIIRSTVVSVEHSNQRSTP